MASKRTQPVNRHGRRGGRGLRPWLLIPKYLAVGAYLGGVLAVAVLGLSVGASGRTPQAPDPIIRLLIFRLILPAATLAALLGVGLWLTHPRVFLRMRWFQLKMLLIIVALPTAELIAYSQLSSVTDGAIVRFSIAIFATLAIAIGIMTLGRLKPRLGQPIRAAARSAPPGDDP